MKKASYHIFLRNREQTYTYSREMDDACDCPLTVLSHNHPRHASPGPKKYFLRFSPPGHFHSEKGNSPLDLKLKNRGHQSQDRAQTSELQQSNFIRRMNSTAARHKPHGHKLQQSNFIHRITGRSAAARHKPHGVIEYGDEEGTMYDKVKLLKKQPYFEPYFEPYRNYCTVLCNYTI